MAALGAIGSLLDEGIYYVRNTWWTDYSQTSQARLVLDMDRDAAAGTISAMAQVGGVAASHRVYLLDRKAGTGGAGDGGGIIPKIIGTQLVQAGATFKFTGLFTDSERYALMIMDEGDTGSYNAKILDRLTAV